MLHCSGKITQLGDLTPSFKSLSWHELAGWLWTNYLKFWVSSEVTLEVWPRCCLECPSSVRYSIVHLNLIISRLSYIHTWQNLFIRSLNCSDDKQVLSPFPSFSSSFLKLVYSIFLRLLKALAFHKGYSAFVKILNLSPQGQWLPGPPTPFFLSFLRPWCSWHGWPRTPSRNSFLTLAPSVTLVIRTSFLLISLLGLDLPQCFSFLFLPL